MAEEITRDDMIADAKLAEAMEAQTAPVEEEKKEEPTRRFGFYISILTPNDTLAGSWMEENRTSMSMREAVAKALGVDYRKVILDDVQPFSNEEGYWRSNNKSRVIFHLFGSKDVLMEWIFDIRYQEIY